MRAEFPLYLQFPILLALPLAAACSDYNIDSVDKGEGGEDTEEIGDTGEDPVLGDPDLVVDPEVVDLGILCGPGGDTLSLSNQGEATLTVTDLVLSGGDWAFASEPSLPLTLEAGASKEVSLRGSAGEGKLEVVSDDPDSPLVTVPLSVSPDEAPTVEITTPGDTEVLAVGGTTAFEASLSDDADALNELTVSWASDVDGVVATDFADDSGVTSFDWDAGSVSSGSHTVTVTVTDTCGNSASDSVSICQNEGYVEDSIDTSSWNFEGSANWDSGNSWVELTGPSIDQAGTAFQTSTTVDADNVSIEFQFFVSGGSGADGFSLTALDSTRMTGFVGSTGGGIGYAGLPGWSIEVDTYYNGAYYDPTTADHLSVHIDGDNTAYVAWSALPEMEDGSWHTMAVTMSGGWLTVEIDGTAYIDQAVSGISNFPAYVGFTAATGSLTNYHLIDALEVEKYVCEE